MNEEPVLNVNKFLELINYESRMLLDLCSELEYSQSESLANTYLVIKVRLDSAMDCCTLVTVTHQRSHHSSSGSNVDNWARCFDVTC